MSTALHILLYGLVAATSPLALGATLVVLRSGHGRLNGLAFAIGVLIGQAAVFLILLALGSAWVPGGSDAHTVTRGLFDLGFGVALLVAAWQVRRRPARPPRPPGVRGRRTAALQAHLARLGPIAALGAGALLGVGGPKRLGITFLAASDTALADFSTTGTAALMVAYVLVATVLVWAPVLAYLLFADRAADWLERRQTWLHDHERAIIFDSSLVLGMLLVIGGVVQLLAAG